MLKRRYGQNVTYETRAESNETVDRQKRYAQVIECYGEVGTDGLTAKECAVLMMKKGFIPTSERNFAAPRITELSYKGILEPIGKRRCRYTGKTVTAYGMRDSG